MLRVGKLVHWELFEPVVTTAVTTPAQGPGGRPRFHPLLKFKVLVLQRLHDRADNATGFQITDRHSFRAFLGLTPGDAVPTSRRAATSSRRSLTPRPSTNSLTPSWSTLQQEHGLALAQEGVMIDASFCEVPRQRNSRAENVQIKAGEVPQWLQDAPKVRAHKDLDARWTKKPHATPYGYKGPVKVEVRDKLILKAVVTTASVHDS